MWTTRRSNLTELEPRSEFPGSEHLYIQAFVNAQQGRGFTRLVKRTGCAQLEAMAFCGQRCSPRTVGYESQITWKQFASHFHVSTDIATHHRTIHAKLIHTCYFTCGQLSCSNLFAKEQQFFYQRRRLPFVHRRMFDYSSIKFFTVFEILLDLLFSCHAKQDIFSHEHTAQSWRTFVFPLFSNSDPVCAEWEMLNVIASQSTPSVDGAMYI